MTFNKFRVCLVVTIMTIFQSLVIAQKHSTVIQKNANAVKAKAPNARIKEVPDHIKVQLFPDPATHFMTSYQKYVDENYKTSLQSVGKSKEQYTIDQHKIEMVNALDIPETFNFEYSQYVRFIDWNGKYYFLTLHHNPSNGDAALEFIDSTLTRHNIIYQASTKSFYLKTTNKAHESKVYIMPASSSPARLMPLIEPSAYAGKTKTMVEPEKILTFNAERMNVSPVYFNQAELAYVKDYTKSKLSVIEVLAPFLPAQFGHMAENAKINGGLFLRMKASFGDKPFFETAWKTVKVGKKPHLISLAKSQKL